jgi:tRNA-specific 2-thiouridylase
MRVLAAMSGGVDSAVAAALAVEAGHEVVGVHMALSRTPAAQRNGSRGCCSIEDASDARRAADVLGIPFYVWDLSATFEQTVVADFLTEYAAGRTPNPCVRCNEHVKFAALLDRALALGFDAVCTGHYAQLGAGPDGQVQLRRAACQGKDQSYVLAVSGPDRLAHAMFPLGEVPSKEQVRALAVARGLRVADKPDSYDICFVADGDTGGFLRARLGSAPGDVVDEDGAVLGRHEGAYAYTVGQRRGLALGRPAADGRPRYVLAVEPVTNRVVVGPGAALEVSALTGTDAVWFDAPDAPVGCQVQVRAHADPVAATAVAGPDGAVQVLLDPGATLRGVAPGQSAVLYDGPRVLGQVTISATVRRGQPVPAAAGAGLVDVAGAPG